MQKSHIQNLPEREDRLNQINARRRRLIQWINGRIRLKDSDIKLADNLKDIAPAATSRDFADPLSKPLDRFPVDADLRVRA